MARVSNELRNVFIRLHKQKQKPIEIAKTLNITRQTITNWIRLLEGSGEERLFKEFKPVGTPTKLNLEELRKEFETNKTAFNREIAVKFNCSTRTIEKYRHRFGYTRKRGRTKYKEANLELKKSI
jgi:transposase